METILGQCWPITEVNPLPANYDRFLEEVEREVLSRSSGDPWPRRWRVFQDWLRGPEGIKYTPEEGYAVWREDYNGD